MPKNIFFFPLYQSTLFYILLWSSITYAFPSYAAIVKSPKITLNSAKLEYFQFEKDSPKSKKNTPKTNHSQEVFMLALVILPLTFSIGITGLILGLVLSVPILWIVGVILAITALVWWIILLFADVGDLS